MKTLALLLLVAFSARAEVVIYTQSIKDTATGNGAVKSTSNNGWLLFDTDTYEVVDIITNTKTKTFSEYGSDAEVEFLTTGSSKYTLWAILPVYDSGGASFKGTATVLNIGTANSFYIPKMMTVNGAAFQSSITTLHEFTGSISYDSKSTIAANKAGQGIDEVANALINSLQNKGYVEF